MNSGLLTSFAIGGILTLAILAMNLNVDHSSTQLTMRQVAQQDKQTIADFIENDIPKIGYDKYTTISNPISVAKQDDLVFQSNINRDGVKKVTWSYDATKSIPLRRIVDGAITDLSTGLKNFRFIYFNAKHDTLSTPVSSPSSIRYIKVEFTTSSKEKLGNAGSGGARYIQSPWEETFAPKNIQ